MNTRLQTDTQTAPTPSFTPVRTGLLQRKCACGGTPGLDGECAESHNKRLSLQRHFANGTEPSTVPPIVHDVLRSPGQPMDPATRAFMEPRFGHDFSRVRVHTDAKAAESARAVNALAYTAGRDVVFQSGAFRPETVGGMKLLAHELTHTVQQSAAGEPTLAARLMLHTTPERGEAEMEADRAAADIVAGQRIAMFATHRSAPVLQRQVFHTPSVSVRSPVFEETVTQLTEFEEARSLTREERDLARGIFGASIDYSRVRLVPTSILEYRTVANSIRIPENFTITNPEMAQTFIHEMTHVWQYQRGGTSYMSISLGTQISAHVGRGNRNFAYEYQINPGQSFFNFTPEQQAFMVENYFAMSRDRAAIPRDQAAGREITYNSNHLDSRGFPAPLLATDRLAEIARELPLHEPLIRQMRTALPRRETDILMLRAMDVMQTPGENIASVPTERRLTPLKPLIQITFPGL